jgi:hypothetical protein
MRISRESLEREAAATGFRAEILENVIHLLSLLDGRAPAVRRYRPQLSLERECH